MDGALVGALVGATDGELLGAREVGVFSVVLEMVHWMEQ